MADREPWFTPAQMKAFGMKYTLKQLLDYECTLSEVDQLYWNHQCMTRETYDLYRCAWRNGAPRISDECIEHHGHEPGSCPIAMGGQSWTQ